MEYSLEGHERLWNQLYVKLKQKAEKIAFLELNKDIFPGNKVGITRDIPLPISSGHLIEGIKTNEYTDNINLNNSLESMAYIIGCDRDFKHNQAYTNIIKGIGSEMKDVLLNNALKLLDEGCLQDALIYFISIERIYGASQDISFNISNVLRELALEAERKHKEDDYELYYLLSFYEFSKLSKMYPEFYDAHFYLGYYYMMEKQYDDASREWEEASLTAPDEEAKAKTAQLLDSLQDNMDFERGKELIELDGAMEGLKLLIPLLEKNNEWNELKFFTALGYRKLGNYMKARLLLTELADSGETFPETYNELGLCYFNLKDPQKAVECFEKASSAMEDEPSLLCNLGIAYYEAGDTLKAKEKIDKAYRLAPHDEMTKICKNWMNDV